MNESNGVRWAHYDEVPDGERRGEHFTHWKDFGEHLGIRTLGVTFLHLEPDDRGPMHAHDDPVEDLYFVLDGSVDIETPDETISVEPGTLTYFEPGAPHRPANNSDEPATVLAFRVLAADGSVNFR